MSDEPTYNVRWQRQDDPEILECRNLDLRTATARLIGAIRASGPITVHSIERTEPLVIPWDGVLEYP